MAHKNKTNISPYKTRQAERAGGQELRGKHKKPQQVYNANEADDRLRDIFQNHDFGHISHPERRKLAEFYVLLMQTQEHENFTRLLKLRDIAIRHFIDCLIIPQLTELKFPLLDMGTGPGFPGIPLKIHFPNDRIILGEGVQRRVEFLKHVRSELRLENLDIIGRNINPHFMYPINGVITRAVEDVGNTLGNVLFSLQTGGRIYLMKGPNVDPEIKPALERWGEFYKLAEDHKYVLPHTTHERRLLVFEKIKAPPLADLDAILDAEFDADPEEG